MRLYLGEIVSLVLAIAFCFVAAAVAARYFRHPAIRLVRNGLIALIVAIFAASMVYSITVNQVPRGQIDRTAVDQDQKAFEQRHK